MGCSFDRMQIPQSQRLRDNSSFGMTLAWPSAYVIPNDTFAIKMRSEESATRCNFARCADSSVGSGKGMHLLRNDIGPLIPACHSEQANPSSG